MLIWILLNSAARQSFDIENALPLWCVSLVRYFHFAIGISETQCCPKPSPSKKGLKAGLGKINLGTSVFTNLQSQSPGCGIVNAVLSARDQNPSLRAASQLLSNGVAVPIGAHAFEIIEVLVQSANEPVTKNDLMDRIWPGSMVGENTPQVHISAIRKAPGPDRAMLSTASGRGYRLPGSWALRQPGSGDRAGFFAAAA
jgi:hypothetical protein